MGKDILEIRRKYVRSLLEQGASVYDVARFFELPPRSIGRTLKRMGIEYEKMDTNERIGDSFLKARDEMLAGAIERNSGKSAESVLREYGFLKFPSAFEESQTIREFQSNDPVYLCMLEKLTVSETAAKLGISYKEAKKRKNSLDIDMDRYKEEAKFFKKAKEMSILFELKCAGFNPTDISRYLGWNFATVENMSAKIGKEITRKAKENEEFATEYAKNLAPKGYSIDEISELTGLSEHNVAQILQKFKSEEKPFAFKSELRREKVFKMYSEDLMTQEEIAEKLGLTRSTVNSDLKMYKKLNPENVDKTYLWRQRNLNKDKKAERIDRKAKLMLLQRAGYSASNIAKQLGVGQGTLERYVSEEGLEIKKTASEITKEKRREAIRNYLKEGLSIADICVKMNLSVQTVKHYAKQIKEEKDSTVRRAEELKLSWQGASTTDITYLVGRSRAMVLRDQHKTADVLRLNNAALSYVKRKNGDVVEEATEYCKWKSSKRSY